MIQHHIQTKNVKCFSEPDSIKIHSSKPYEEHLEPNFLFLNFRHTFGSKNMKLITPEKHLLTRPPPKKTELCIHTCLQNQKQKSDTSKKYSQNNVPTACIRIECYDTKKQEQRFIHNLKSHSVVASTNSIMSCRNCKHFCQNALQTASV